MKTGAMVKAGILCTIVCGVGLGAYAKAPLPDKIPIGPADENTETSAAVTEILSRCAETFKTVPAVHAAGTYVYAEKYDETTSYTSAKIRMDFVRPNKLAVVTSSSNLNYECAFYANGTTVTQVSSDDKQYIEMPQPDLASYATNYRNGELNDDFSGALGMVGTSALLTAPDPLESLQQNVTRYVYEGEETVGKYNCYRIRFIQEHPESIVIVWIDKSTWLMPKISVIESFDKDYKMVDSFEAGQDATMTVVNWDVMSTKAERISVSDFKPKIPGNFDIVDSNPAKKANPKYSGGNFWESLVGTAAETSKQETTWSLTRRSGTVNLKLEEFANLDKPARDGDSSVDANGKPTGLTLLTDDKDIRVYNYDGSLNHKLPMPEAYSKVAYMDTSTSEPLLLLAADDSDSVHAYKLDGTSAWTYSHPYSIVKMIRTVRNEVAAYIDLGSNGVRKLDDNGQVMFANANVTQFGNPAIAPAGTDRIVVRDSRYNIRMLNKNLKELSQIDVDDYVLNILWDKDNAESPLVCHTVTHDSDILLQRRNANGDIVSTTMVEPKMKNAYKSVALWMNLKIDGKIQEVIAVFVSDGNLYLAEKSGKVIYRGIVKANDALVKQNDGSVMRWTLQTDANNDGQDEIYFPLNTHLMRIVTE